jgi:hypothetical protein
MLTSTTSSTPSMLPAPYPSYADLLHPSQHQMYINSPADDTSNKDEIRISTRPRRIPKKKTFSTMSQKEREALYDFSHKTNRIKVADGVVDFVKHFKYLGYLISFDLTDDFDTDHRISTANKAMGALKHLWDNPYADLKAKQQTFIALPGSLLLWGCESWALGRSHIMKLEVFWHRSIRRILKIGMMQVKEARITNERTRKIFMNIPSAEDTWKNSEKTG